MRRKGNDYDGVLTLLILVMMLMFALPFFGVKQIQKGAAINVVWGSILIILGVGFWIWIAISA